MEVASSEYVFVSNMEGQHFLWLLKLISENCFCYITIWFFIEKRKQTGVCHMAWPDVHTQMIW